MPRGEVVVVRARPIDEQAGRLGSAAAPLPPTTGGSDASGLSWDTVAQTAHLTLETSRDATNHGLNFNGYSNGGMTIRVPLNYRVTVTVVNHGPFPHSAVITAYANRQNTKIFPPAFDGASTSVLVAIACPPAVIVIPLPDASPAGARWRVWLANAGSGRPHENASCSI